MILIIRTVVLKIDSEQWAIEWHLLIDIVSDVLIDVCLVPENLARILWLDQSFLASLFDAHHFVVIVTSDFLDLVSELGHDIEHFLEVEMHAIRILEIVR